MSDLLVLHLHLIVLGRARLAHVKSLVRHLLLLFSLADRHAVIGTQ